MTLRGYLGIFRERWLIVAICTVAGLLVAAAILTTQPKQYSSQITFYVSAQSSDAATAYDDSLLAKEKLSTYIELLNEPRVAEDVSQRLGGRVSPGAVTDSIATTSPPETSLIRVDITAGTPDGAQRIAAALAEGFPPLVTAIESEANPRPTATAMIVRVLYPPSFSSAPVAPGVESTLILGLLLGLAVGMVAAVARNGLDDSVRTPESLERAVGAPVLGPTGRDPSAATRFVVVGKTPASPLSAAYADLRTHLSFALADKHHQVLVATAPHAGVGTTTTLCNLAAAFGRAGRRTILVEADLRHPTIGSRLGIEHLHGLGSVLDGTADLDACVRPWREGHVDVLLAGSITGDPSEVLASGRIEKVFDELRHRYDLVLVDAPPALAGSDVDLIAADADGMLLLGRWGRTTTAEVRRTVAELAVTGTAVLGAVLTMVRLPGVRPEADAGTASTSGDDRAPRGAVASWWRGVVDAFRPAKAPTLAGNQADEGSLDSAAESTPATRTVPLTRRPSPRPRTSEGPTC